MARRRRSNLPDPARVRAELAKAAHIRRKTLIRRSALVVACCALAGVAVALLLPRHSSPAPQPVSKVDSNARACVLSDQNDPSLAVVDAGLQQLAKADGRLNVQNYSVPGTATDAAPYLNGMIAGRCSVVIGIGALAAQAIESYVANGSSGSSAAKLIVIAASTPQTAHIAALSPATLTPNAIAAQVRADLR